MDPSNSFESQAFFHANDQLEQTDTITCMDLDSYNAAAQDKIEVFKDIINHQSLDLLLTPNKNTILHVYITALNSKSKPTTPNVGSESTTTLNVGLESTTLNARSVSRTNFVEEILNMCPSLLRQANVKGETPLHIAARYGHDDIVDVLIKYCSPTLHQDLEGGIEALKEMLRTTNNEKDTALHEAVRYNHLEVVELLIKEDSNFSYSANDAGETPLYIAAERRFKDVLFEILHKCKSPILYGGPLGRTALHAAVIQKDEDMIRRILEKIEGISRKVDNKGWTPLHLDAYLNHSYLTKSSFAKLLLDNDRHVAYMKDKEGRTALHIAAQCGNAEVMSDIVLRCPDCCELVDKRGWNVLHFAMKGSKYNLEDTIKIIIENSSLSNLLNEKNADGDTPLQYYSKSMMNVKSFICHPRVDKMVFNKQNFSAYDIALTNDELPEEKMSQIKKAIHPRPPRRVITFEDEDKKDNDEDKEKEDQRSLLQKAAEAHLVVAALITTVTFAACITMPGGFAGGGEDDSHPGSALLRRNAAFKAFIITDTISMVLSSSAVFIHLFTPFLFNKYVFSEEHRNKILLLAFVFIMGAVVAMGLAFVTGTYAVLVPSLDIAIPNLIIGLTFFASLLFGILKISRHSFFQLLLGLIYSFGKCLGIFN